MRDTLRPGTHLPFSQDILPHTRFQVFTLVNDVFFDPFYAFSAYVYAKWYTHRLYVGPQSVRLISC